MIALVVVAGLLALVFMAAFIGLPKDQEPVPTQARKYEEPIVVLQAPTDLRDRNQRLADQARTNALWLDN